MLYTDAAPAKDLAMSVERALPGLLCNNSLLLSVFHRCDRRCPPRVPAARPRTMRHHERAQPSTSP
jgi:hypothetical protein